MNDKQVTITRSWWWVLAAITAFAWVLWLLSIPAGEWIEDGWGPQISDAVRLRTYDVSQFLQRRMLEVAFLVSLFCGLLGSLVWCFQRTRSFGSQLLRMLVFSLVGFGFANLFVWGAMHTATYWLLLHLAGPDYRLPCVSSEWLMLKESVAETKGILMGSSQAAAQIDVKGFNQLFGPAVQFANLSYVGSEPFDMLMLQNYLDTDPDVVICYLSEMSFFRGVANTHALTLASPQTSRDLVEVGAAPYFSPLSHRYSKLANSLPLFRCRRAVESALFGVTGTPAVPFRIRSAAERKEVKRSGLEEFVDSFSADGQPLGVQQAALTKLMQNFQVRGARVVLIAGSVNERVSGRLDPQLRPQMLLFLRQLAARFDNVVVAEEGQELPRATPNQYADMTHLAEELRPWYSAAVADYLSQQFDW